MTPAITFPAIPTAPSPKLAGAGCSTEVTAAAFFLALHVSLKDQKVAKAKAESFEKIAGLTKSVAFVCFCTVLHLLSIIFHRISLIEPHAPGVSTSIQK